MRKTDHNYYGAFPGYEVQEKVYCARCTYGAALRTTRMGFTVQHGRLPLSVEEMIAYKLTELIEKRIDLGDIVLPVGVYDTVPCERCKAPLGVRKENE